MHALVHLHYPVKGLDDGIILDPIMFNLDFEFSRDTEMIPHRPLEDETKDRILYVPCQFGGVTKTWAVEIGADYSQHIFQIGDLEGDYNFSRINGRLACILALVKMLYPVAMGKDPDIWIKEWNRVITTANAFDGYVVKFSTPEVMRNFPLTDPDRILTTTQEICDALYGGQHKGKRNVYRERLGRHWWMNNNLRKLPTVQELIGKESQRTSDGIIAHAANIAATIPKAKSSS